MTTNFNIMNKKIISKQAIPINMRFILPLTMAYLTIYLISASVSYRMVSFGNFQLSGPPLIFPLSYAISDIIAEVYGLSIAKKIIWLTLIFELLYAAIIQLIIVTPFPSNWQHHEDYDIVFGNLLLFVISGFFAVIFSSFINIYLITKWKVMLYGKHLAFRSLMSSLIGGFFLVAIIVVFAYSKLDISMQSLKLFSNIYLWEALYSLILTIPVYFLSVFLKKKEQLDVYDSSINFNPFKFD